MADQPANEERKDQECPHDRRRSHHQGRHREMMADQMMADQMVTEDRSRPVAKEEEREEGFRKKKARLCLGLVVPVNVGDLYGQKRGAKVSLSSISISL